MRNVKLALRTLFKTPFVTTVAILSLALGIGANAAIFSMFDEILLESVPVAHPEQLVNLGAPGPKPGGTSCNQTGDCDETFSYPMFRDLEKAAAGAGGGGAFSSMAAHRSFSVNLAMAGQTPISGQGMLVSGSYFPTLGLRPALGRLFSPDDDRTIGGHFVAVLSYGYWENQLGADPNVVGQRMIINGQQMTILGVAPRDFIGTTLGTRPYVFVPITMRGVMSPGFGGFNDRRQYWVYTFARLKPGVTIDQARAAVNAVYRPIINDVEAPLQKGMSQQTMTKFRAKLLTLEDGRRGQTRMNKEAKTPLLLLFSITGIVLLIACANIANLLLARAANRSMEMAVRLSLGASRRQLVAQLLTESILLAMLGGVVSLVVAYWTLNGIVRMLPPEATTSMTFNISTPAVLFTAALSLFTGIVFGLIPAIQSTRPDLVTDLRNNSGKLAGGRGAARFRTSLVTAQIALSMALLISAGLFIKSLRNVSRVDLGIKIDNMVTFNISPILSGYDTTRAKALFARYEQELSSMPGTSAVTSSVVPILSGDNWGNSVFVEGFKKQPDTDDESQFNAVGPNYFTTFGVPLLAGRDFREGDGATNAKVAIVNEAFAKKFNLGSQVIGKHMSIFNDSLNIEIVGLAKDSKYAKVKDKIPPVYAIPYRQMDRLGSLVFYVRSSLPTDQVVRGIRDVSKRLDPNLPIEDLKTMPQQVRENVFLDRMISTMSAAFAALATLLAAIGLYGVLAYSVAQRTREIGVRMALGADGARVRGMVLRQVGMMTLVGGVIGVAGAVGLGKGAQSLLYQLQGYDPFVFATAIALLVVVALGAGYLPALRASRIDPMTALRYE
ncbi:MAG TPA: ABC transporter permease [Gemmatimonadaceae bacterium]